MSHGIDLVHWFMDDHFPRSMVAHGGIFAWQDGRENPDTFQALAEYPKGRLSRAARFAADILNGVPSIVIGMFAYGLAVLPVRRFSALATPISRSRSGLFPSMMFGFSARVM